MFESKIFVLKNNSCIPAAALITLLTQIQKVFSSVAVDMLSSTCVF